MKTPPGFTLLQAMLHAELTMARQFFGGEEYSSFQGCEAQWVAEHPTVPHASVLYSIEKRYGNLRKLAIEQSPV
jgi:hypothetical protein